MSHTMDIKIDIHDLRALEAACRRLHIHLKYGEHRLYASTETGNGIFLEGWRYPVVIQEGGGAKYDNYGGSWGKIEKLHELEAYYGLEKAKFEAQLKGYDFQETVSAENMPRLEIYIN
ncbi:MAG: hypothetical protein MRJ65_15445 [Candidatus Brocadiaceae bacterium]|nr:hypothetical protein [Candidatus Brocadiaceae bacterium]